jgi:hypothetical protein
VEALVFVAEVEAVGCLWYLLEDWHCLACGM